ncbi:MAG: hypothetical protein J0I10_00580 [Verrucomicrobia bacterium]|nr:hypothetical protein [Verrucomicrobiota bacterium]
MPGLPAEEPNPNPLEEFREPDYRLSDGDEDIRQPVNHDHHDPIRGFNDLPDREGYRPNDERRDCQANDGEADDIDGIDFTPTP